MAACGATGAGAARGAATKAVKRAPGFEGFRFHVSGLACRAPGL